MHQIAKSLIFNLNCCFRTVDRLAKTKLSHHLIKWLSRGHFFSSTRYQCVRDKKIKNAGSSGRKNWSGTNDTRHFQPQCWCHLRWISIPTLSIQRRFARYKEKRTNISERLTGVTSFAELIFSAASIQGQIPESKVVVLRESTLSCSRVRLCGSFFF